MAPDPDFPTVTFCACCCTLHWRSAAGMAEDEETRAATLAADEDDVDAEVFNLTTTRATHDVGPRGASAGGGGSADALSSGLAYGEDEGAPSSPARLGGSPGKGGMSSTAGGTSGYGGRGRSSKGLTTTRFESVVNDTASRARVAVDEGTEEHWNHVMKKLAPQGYQKTPIWQKRILERVLKRARRPRRAPAHAAPAPFCGGGGAASFLVGEARSCAIGGRPAMAPVARSGPRLGARG